MCAEALGLLPALRVEVGDGDVAPVGHQERREHQPHGAAAEHADVAGVRTARDRVDGCGQWLGDGRSRGGKPVGEGVERLLGRGDPFGEAAEHPGRLAADLRAAARRTGAHGRTAPNPRRARARRCRCGLRRSRGRSGTGRARARGGRSATSLRRYHTWWPPAPARSPRPPARAPLRSADPPDRAERPRSRFYYRLQCLASPL